MPKALALVPVEQLREIFTIDETSPSGLRWARKVRAALETEK